MVVAGRADGVFSSVNSGAHWSLLGGKPVHDDVRDVAFDRGSPVRLNGAPPAEAASCWRWKRGSGPGSRVCRSGVRR